jgi:hypothetical protein
MWSQLPLDRMQYEAINLSSVRGPTMQTGEGWLVPAPMREEAFGIVQPLDSAGTYRMATKRVPAPRLELGTP